MQEIKVLFKEGNKRRGRMLVIRDNPEYPESVEVVKIEGIRHECYLLPKKAIIKTAEALERQRASKKLDALRG